jgi:NTE family protein
LIVVGINPIVRAEVPRSARAIIDRIGEISFNASFMDEVSAIAFFEELMQSRPADRRFRRLFLHGIGDEALGAFGASSKMNNHPDFLAHLCEIGTRVADRWLADHRKAVGKRSTVDLSGLLPTRHGSLIGPAIIN